MATSPAQTEWQVRRAWFGYEGWRLFDALLRRAVRRSRVGPGDRKLRVSRVVSVMDGGRNSQEDLNKPDAGAVVMGVGMA